MTKITYGTKTAVEPQVSHATQFWADDANEVKAAVNENDTVDTSTSATILFDTIQGYRHGTWTSPISGDITLDETGVVEGGCAVVLWEGSTNPTYIGGTIQSISGDITVEGVYSIYIHYINGRFNINVFNVENPGDPSYILFKDDFTGTTIDTNKWTVVEPNTAKVEITQNDKLIFTSKSTSTETTFINYLVSAALDLTTLKVITFDIFKGADNSNLWSIGLNLHSPPLQTDYISIQKSNTNGNIWLRVWDSGAGVHQDDITLDIETTIQTFKIVINTDIEYYHWTGGAWVQIGTTFSTHGLTGNYYPYLTQQDSTTATNFLDVDNFVVTDTDFSTQRP